MIDWPAEEKLTGHAKSNMDRFRKTAAAKELEDDKDNWFFHSWARTEDPPHRMILMNENGDELVFTLESSGIWVVRRKDRP